MESVFSTPLMLIAVALAVGLGIVGVQRYQRCPHCGRIVRRVARGWRRCGACGRQYRKGLRLR